MDALTLSRLQFAVTAAFHFIFVPLTLGLSILIAYMESRYVRTNDEMYLKMAKFWGKLFLINFALGIVTGITMEFQFGMNWAEYSKYVGDIFGAPLAIEATVAFFWNPRLSDYGFSAGTRYQKESMHFLYGLLQLQRIFRHCGYFLQTAGCRNPVGYVLRNNRAEMVDFGAMLTNPYGWLKFSHTLLSGYVVAAFFVMGISAYHLLKKTNTAFFKRSFKMAAAFGLMSSLLVFIVGDFHAAMVARTQPTKFAAMESVWDTQKAVPYNFLVIPDVKNERNTVSELGIPKLLSLLAFHDGDAEIKGLKEFSKEDRPPVLATFLSFRGMAALGMLFMLLTLAGYVISKRDRLESNPLFLRIMLYALPLPYIAAQLGWLVAEVGRQPWIVYGVLRTSDAVSKSVTAAQVWTSLIGFTVFYGMLGLIDIYLLAKYSKKGPDDDLSAIIKSPREV